MHYNPLEQSQMPTRMIKLKSSDGEIFKVEVKVAQLSLSIKEMLNDLGVEENEVIPIPENAPEISGTILKKIIQWANHHKDDPAEAEDDEKKVKPTDGNSSWDAEFLQVDQSTLFQMIRAANYLNVKGLLDVTCKKVAKMIEEMTPEEVRQRFNIQNDFSPDEEEQIRNENSWHGGFHLGENNGRPLLYRRMVSEVPADSLQNGDNEDHQVIQDCLKNSVVVRKIFQHLYDYRLFELSVVNKIWYYEARSLMRKRANVMAQLQCVRCPTQPCQQTLEAFGADLRKMNIVPYSGLTIVIRPTMNHADGTAALESAFETILERLPLKHLSVILIGKWWNHKDFPAILLLQQLFQDFQGVLQKLKLTIWERPEEFIEHFVQDCNFPALRALELLDGSDPYRANYVKALVSRAKCLEKLETNGHIDLLENILERREAVHMYTSGVSAPFDRISESVIHKLRLKEMHLRYTGLQFNFERFNRFTPLLLQASCTTTLCKMFVDAVLAVPLMCYGISLGNVKWLEMEINYGQLDRVQPQMLRIVKNFDFTRIFPNVDKVKIWRTSYDVQLSPDHLNRIIEQANASFQAPIPNRAANIKELDLNQRSVTLASVQLFTEMFPCLEKLKVATKEQRGEFPFGLIWKHWLDLKYLEVTGKMFESRGNLDSVFCGIFPEEVAELRLKDEDYLMKVNIVPVMPSIACLKNLETIDLNRNPRSYEHHVDDGTFMFSKVTALIAFARFPSLAVNLVITSYGTLPAITHLKPNMSVKSIWRVIGDWND